MGKANHLKVLLLLTGMFWITLSQQVVGFEPPDTNAVYTVVDEMPEIVGGISALYAAMDVPESVKSGYLEGRVFLKFVIDRNGKVIRSRVLKDIGDNCGQIALKAAEQIAFTPGKLDDTNVKVTFTMPVLFSSELFDRTQVILK